MNDIKPDDASAINNDPAGFAREFTKMSDAEKGALTPIVTRELNSLPGIKIPTNESPASPAPTTKEAIEQKMSRGESLTEKENSFWQFMKNAEIRRAKLFEIGNTRTLPLSADSRNPFLIGADPAIGVMQIDGGANNIIGKIINKRINMSPDEQQKLEESIADYNEGKPSGEQRHEGFREINDILKSTEKEAEFSLFDNGRWFTANVKLEPKQTIVEAAMAKNSPRPTILEMTKQKAASPR